MSDIDSIINKYVQGTTTETENTILAEWLNESPENKNKLFSEKDIWDTYVCHFDHKRYNIDSELQVLRSKLTVKNTSNVTLLNRIIRIAAVILITFGLGWSTQFIAFNRHSSVQEATIQEIVVPKGQVSQVFLADGTRVWINSESKLKVLSVFSSNERKVQLNGEAYFEVAKDPKRPFRVEVNGQKIEVLGTSFNVRAYSNHRDIQTTLSNGKIQLFTGDQRSILNPGEQSIFNLETKQLSINKVDPSNYTSWKEGRFEFQNENLVDVFKVIERWYDVEIQYKESDFKGMRFSGVIKRNKDVKHFLNLLNHSIPVTYSIDLDKITIAPK